MKPLIKTPCDYCGKPVLTTAWNRPVFCHDDCAERYDGDVNFLDCPDTDDADNGDPPRIVSTDPPMERIAADFLLNDAYPPSVIKLDPEEFQTITVTASKP